MTRADDCRKAAEATASDNERGAWLAAAAAWDGTRLPKPPLTDRGRQLAALYRIKKQLAEVPSAEQEPKPEPPTASPEPPKPEPTKPKPAGAFATIDF